MPLSSPHLQESSHAAGERGTSILYLLITNAFQPITGLGILAVTSTPRCGGPSPFGNKRCPTNLADHPLWGRKDLWDKLLAITLGKVNDPRSQNGMGLPHGPQNYLAMERHVKDKYKSSRPSSFFPSVVPSSVASYTLLRVFFYLNILVSRAQDG